MERCLICGKQMEWSGEEHFPRCAEHGNFCNQTGCLVEQHRVMKAELLQAKADREKYRAALQTVRSYVSGVKGPERPVVLATIDEALGE